MRQVGSVLIAVLLLGASPGSGQPPKTDEGPEISGELAKLNIAVREIADLLAKQSEGQKLELLMKRLELASAKATQSEQRQRSLQSEKTKTEDEKQRTETTLRQIQYQADTQLSPDEKAGLQAATERADVDLKRTTSRLQSLAQEIAEIDAALATQREELRDWQRVLDRGLSSF